MKPNDHSNKSSPQPHPLIVEEKLRKRFYTTTELVRVTGMTRKQVVYWAKTELLVPSLRDPQARGSRPTSFYSARDVIKALTICELLHAGFSLQQVRQLAKNLEEGGLDPFGHACYLLTDGYSVYSAETEGEVMDILKNHRQLLLLVPIHEQVEKLAKAG